MEDDSKELTKKRDQLLSTLEQGNKILNDWVRILTSKLSKIIFGSIFILIIVFFFQNGLHQEVDDSGIN